MRKDTLPAVTCGLLLIGANPATEAASTEYLRFANIDPQPIPTNKAYKGYSEVLNFNWSIAFLPVLAFSDVNWSQIIDTGTSQLLAEYGTGERIPTVEFAATTNTGFEYYSLEFKDVFLTSLSFGSGGGSTLVNGSFTYGEVTMTVTPMNITGGSGTSVSASFETGKPLPALVISQLSDLNAAVVVPIPASLPLFAGALGLVAATRRRS